MAQDAVADSAARREAAALADVVEGLAGEFRLRPLLARVLHAALALLHCTDGSISLVDHATSTYRKEVDVGVVCESGRTFPLDEGLTGAVVRAGGPVVVDSYAEVLGGHLRAADRARLHAAVGIPVVWGGAVLGAVVVFSADPARRFDARDVGLLGLFARHAAIAITNARLHAEAAEHARARAAAREHEELVREVVDAASRDLAVVLGHARRGDATSAAAAARTALLRLREGGAAVAPDAAGPGSAGLEEAVERQVAWARAATGLQVRCVVAGQVRVPDPAVTELLVRAARAVVVRAVASSREGRLRVGLVHGAERVVLLAEDDGDVEGPPPAGEDDLGDLGDLQRVLAAARELGGSGEAFRTPGWGTSLRVSLPYRTAGSGAGRARVLVVDGRPAARAGHSALLGASAGVRVVGDVGRAGDVPSAVELLRPDVVLLGAALPDAPPPDVLAALAGAGPGAAPGAGPGVAVVVVAEPVPLVPLVPPGARGRPEDTGWASAAHGVLPPDATGAELAQAVLRAADAALRPRPAPPPASGPVLTPREQQVLALVLQGRSDREIAAELVLSPKTVEKHVGALLRKHEVHRRVALVARRAAG